MSWSWDPEVPDHAILVSSCVDAEKVLHHPGLHQVLDSLRRWNELKLEGIVVGPRSGKLHPYQPEVSTC